MSKTRRPRTLWSAERVDTLRRLWALNQRPGAIAAVLGVEERAVVQKAHRLKLPRRPFVQAIAQREANTPEILARRSAAIRAAKMKEAA